MTNVVEETYVAHPSTVRQYGGFMSVLELFKDMETFRRFYPRSKNFYTTTLENIKKSNVIVRFM